MNNDYIIYFDKLRIYYCLYILYTSIYYYNYYSKISIILLV